MNLSLSPRFDLFRFSFPRDFLSNDVKEKYQEILSRNAGVISSPTDYLNESIKSIHIPGMSDLTMEQVQHESNNLTRRSSGSSDLGKINVEPQHNIVYKTAENPLHKIEQEFQVTFRMNQGLYNYYMLYETVFEQALKTIDRGPETVLYVELLNEKGEVSSRIKFKDCYINGIDGLDFSYDKTSRETGEFNITIKFNNIDFEFLPQTYKKVPS